MCECMCVFVIAQLGQLGWQNKRLGANVVTLYGYSIHCVQCGPSIRLRAQYCMQAIQEGVWVCTCVYVCVT